MLQLDAARARTPKVVLTTVAMVGALFLVACGDDSSSSSTRTTSTSSTTSSSGVDPAKVYAPGVPTMNELYKSVEKGVPPSSSPPLLKDKSIIFVSCGQTSPGCSGIPNAMVAAAKVVGWKYKIIDGANNVNNGWAAGFRQAIAAKPDAIVTTGISCPDVKQPLVEAKAAGIPVMEVEGIDCDNPLTPGGASASLMTSFQFNEHAKDAGEFFAQWGKTQADYIINATQGHAKIVRTFYTPLFGVLQRNAQDAELKKCPDCEVVDEVKWTGPDSVAGGPLIQKWSTVLTRHPDANAAIVNFDSTATSAGLSKAIADAGRAKKMVTAAGGGFAPALELIRGGNGLTADPAWSSGWEAYGVIDELNRLFSGKPLVPQGVVQVMVDKDHNMVPAGKDYSPTFDYESAYKKIWGL